MSPNKPFRTKPVSERVVRLVGEGAAKVGDWHKTARFFARGSTKRLYRKKESGYPKNLLLEHGNVVSIIEGGDRLEAKRRFWEMKIIHELFPENTVRPRGVIHRKLPNGKDIIEIHVDEVPVHEALRKYQESLAERQLPGHDPKSPLLNDCLESVYANLGKISQVGLEMKSAGVNMELNPTNLSLHNPIKPIFLEPYLHKENFGYFKLDINQVRTQVQKYMQQKNYPLEKAKKVNDYFDALERIASM